MFRFISYQRMCPRESTLLSRCTNLGIFDFTFYWHRKLDGDSKFRVGWKAEGLFA